MKWWENYPKNGTEGISFTEAYYTEINEYFSKKWHRHTEARLWSFSPTTLCNGSQNVDIYNVSQYIDCQSHGEDEILSK